METDLKRCKTWKWKRFTFPRHVSKEKIVPLRKIHHFFHSFLPLSLKREMKINMKKKVRVYPKAKENKEEENPCCTAEAGKWWKFNSRFLASSKFHHGVARGISWVCFSTDIASNLSQLSRAMNVFIVYVCDWVW